MGSSIRFSVFFTLSKMYVVEEGSLQKEDRGGRWLQEVPTRVNTDVGALGAYVDPYLSFDWNILIFFKLKKREN